ncbi:phage tail protein [Clostridium intestinale]|uniref:Uncharacterized protein n=1 Tax=Clostridium intestinale URNW TaxID=1294142 RepID=U2Q603_9CLOT|nr:hypothetical protein [Clostridium intestinale]ERK31564.1 hypothetical protein CINTURNW_1038 [Clostridium intestinale URNW]
MADNNSVGKISLDLEIQSDIGKQISTVSNLIGKNLKNSLQSSTKAAFGSMKKNLDSNAKTLRDTLKRALSGAFEGVKNIKLPTPKFPKVNLNTPKQAEAPSTATPRAPPIPKVSSGANAEQIKAQIESLTASLNNTNARIEQQQEKLRGLREQYSSTFNPATKNKLQEQILKTETAINKLVASSDKAGFKLADLDAKLAGAGSAAGQLGNVSNKAGNQANKASNNFKLFGNSVKNTSNNLRGTHNQFNMMMRSIVTWGLIFPAIIKGITATGRFLGQAMMTNQQFTNSLVQIKSNLYTAFMPIYQAVLPAINTLMSALSTATAYFASFMNTLFGKTFKQGMQSAKGLVAAKVAMGAYGESAKKAGKDAKGALAGFDELNILDTSKDEDGAGAGGSKVPEIVAPNLDTSDLDKSTSIWAQRFKQILGTIFNPFKNAWAKDGAGVMAEFRNAVDGTKGTLGNFFSMLATPPVQLFLENVGRLILAIIKLGLRIYDSFILPIVNWFIGILPGAAQGLNPIIEIVTRLVNYLAGDGFTGVQVFLAVVIGLVAGIKTFIVILEVIAWAKNLIVVLKGVWAAMMANPIVLIISIIVGLVAAFMTLWATNENFRNAMKEIWENIKNIFAGVMTWLKDAFVKDWSTVFGIFGDPMNAFFVSARDIFNSVKQVFRGLIDFIAGVFTGDWDRVWRGVVNIFGGIFNGISSIAKAPLNGLIGLVNGVITGLNKISLPDWVPGRLGGMGVNIPKIPYLARGGIIDSPTLAMVGEAGKEAVMPLENNTGWIDLLADKLTQRLGGLNTSGGGNTSTDRAVEIVIQLGGYEFARFIIDSINKLQRQSGRTLLEV